MATRWLISPRFDLAMFAAPAAAGLLLGSLQPALAPDGEVSVAWWVVFVLLVDVAHVWSTIYRTYLDPAELTRRPALYALAPALAYAGSVALYAHGPLSFWRGLAYLAVFHFVRQQYGWVALCHRADPGLGRLEAHVDRVAIYASTLAPLVVWHASPPRAFAWFVPGDFATLGPRAGLVTLAELVLIAALLAFLTTQAARFARTGELQAGKLTVVAGTAAAWVFGIVVWNSDFAFTATNVLVHGIPYFGIVWLYGRRQLTTAPGLLGRVFATRVPLAFYALVVGLAYGEELLWDRTVWLEHDGVFPFAGWPVGAQTQIWWVPLLALPQSVHYVLDAFIWKTRPEKNPGLPGALGLGATPTSAWASGAARPRG